jgi:hypothetical protein
MATLASPQETDGVFQIGAESLSGEVQLSAAAAGSVNGDFSIARTDANTIALDFTASSWGLEDEELVPSWTTEVTLVSGGPGQAILFGTLTVERQGDPLILLLSGTIYFDGDPSGILAANQSIDQSAFARFDSGLTVHTRTLVEDGVTVSVDELVPGANPPPLARIHASPNPLSTSAQVFYTSTHRERGSIRIYSADGRLVRTLLEGTIDPGDHRIHFDGKDDSGRRLAAGGYFVKIQTDHAQAAGKLSILR